MVKIKLQQKKCSMLLTGACKNTQDSWQIAGSSIPRKLIKLKIYNREVRPNKDSIQGFQRCGVQNVLVISAENHSFTVLWSEIAVTAKHYVGEKFILQVIAASAMKIYFDIILRIDCS